MKIPTLPAIISALALMLTSCYYDVEEELYPDQIECNNTKVTFTTHIAPLVSNNCQSCHNNSMMNGNISLEGYENIKAQAENGNLVGAVDHQPGFTPMPQGQPKLPACEIEAIQKWIDNGTPND